MGVIAIPDGDQELKAAVDRVYEDYLQYCEDERDVRKERRKEKVSVALDGFSDETVWEEVERRLSGTETPDKSFLALFKAVDTENIILIKLLVDAGANPFVGDNSEQYSAYDSAKDIESDEVVAYFDTIRQKFS